MNLRNNRCLGALVAAVAGFALVLQYVLLVGATLGTIGPLLATVRFFRWSGRAKQAVAAT